jgi:glycolate oxidase FAD binding subunit
MDARTPASVDDAAAVIAEAHRAGQRVHIRGSGTKMDWGAQRSQSYQPSVQPRVVLSSLALNRVVAHRHGDLTATVEAGARLDEVNRELAAHRQWIPLDPPWSDRATIGGIVATNDSGPRRHRYGAPRDLIIGVHIVRGDGVRAKAGGIVVKNVAGYDLARLMTGSFGSLALITSATFKLYPLAPASRTVVAELPSHAAVRAVTLALNASQLTPTAVEMQAPPLRLLIRFESTGASVDAQSRAAAKIVEPLGGCARIVEGADEAEEWRAHADRPWSGDGAVIKMTLLPGDLADALDLVQRASGGSAFEVAGRAGLGVLYVRLNGDPAAHARVVDALRARVPIARGSVTVLRGDARLKTVDPRGDAGRVVDAVRRSFDPAGVFADSGVE